MYSEPSEDEQFVMANLWSLENSVEAIRNHPEMFPSLDIARLGQELVRIGSNKQVMK